MHQNESEKAAANQDRTMNTMPKNLMVPFLLLSLQNVNLHGYKLIQELAQFGFATIDQGNVYRILRQLEKDQLVHSEWDTTTEGPAKRIYSITKAGEDYLKTCFTTLEQYQSMINRFFNIYMDMLLPSSRKLQEDTEDN
ncbi:poly-beta-hydroxybutyrate-responsive repressor [Bacillus sp. MUM 116]|uniref:poly-beta-hydroxybutyrate-responsive repressor n=1 Tax=Bacillus sp. MUM 116 TaxID=1678002 RepID=UPI0008F5D2BF|nr:poly-beta-hydroxybutyrate-responsive repressor [Bacillus sp. MUM 116]OIK10423.1 poly-beta-hydroxybutyrate-responsive repressor [Bacillus sp. MUM 116]